MAAKKKTVLNEYGDAPKSIDDRPFYSLVLDEDQKNFVNAILRKVEKIDYEEFFKIEDDADRISKTSSPML